MVFRTSLVFGTLLVTAHAAVAAPGGAHRARMSADLQDHLNVGSQTIEVIVDGDAASIDALAARYNLRVSKRIESGAVLTVNAGQLAALRGRVSATKDFLGGDGRDLYGHGTHIAGIIAGQGVSTPDGKDYRGIAFGAYLVNLRVLD